MTVLPAPRLAGDLDEPLLPGLIEINERKKHCYSTVFASVLCGTLVLLPKSFLGIEQKEKKRLMRGWKDTYIWAPHDSDSTDWWNEETRGTNSTIILSVVCSRTCHRILTVLDKLQLFLLSWSKRHVLEPISPCLLCSQIN